MQYRRLGAAGFETSAVGFGCWEMGGTYGAFDTNEMEHAIDRAIALGVTLFDTARVYGYTPNLGVLNAGRSEELLGRALGNRRKDVVIVTKGGVPTRPGQKPTRDSSYDAIMTDCDLSLRALGTDYVDLYLIHWPDPTTPVAETMGALNDLLAAGKTRFVGVCNHTAAQLREACTHAPIIANQVGYNLFDRRWEHEMFATAATLGVGIMAYGTLAHGLLTGAFTPETTFASTDWRARGVFFGQSLFTPENLPTNLAVVERLKAVALRKGLSLPQLALAWVLGQTQVAVALTGMRSPAEIEENAATLATTLSPDERAEIEAIMEGAAGQVTSLPQ